MMTKKILCVFLCLIFLVMAFPVSFLAEENDIPIDAAHFPDKNFRAFLSGKSIDINQNGMLSRKEIDRKSTLILESEHIKDLTGIEYFTKLKNLNCQNNQIVSLDLSKNTELQQLDCRNNQIVSLDLSKNTKLQQLNCQGMETLQTLILGQNTNLKEVNATITSLTQLDLSGCTNLEILNVFQTNITQLDLSKLSKLRVCWHSEAAKTIDVSKNLALEELRCGPLVSELNLKNNSNLKILYVQNNKSLKTLNLWNNQKLVQLVLQNSSITEVKLNAPELYKFTIEDCFELQEINISLCPLLIHMVEHGRKEGHEWYTFYSFDRSEDKKKYPDSYFRLNCDCKIITDQIPEEEPSSKPVEVSKPTEVSSKPVDVSKPTEVSSVPDEISSVHTEVSSEIESSSVEISSVSEISSAETEISSEATSFEEPASSVNGTKEQGSVWWWVAGVVLLAACGGAIFFFVKKKTK